MADIEDPLASGEAAESEAPEPTKKEKRQSKKKKKKGKGRLAAVLLIILLIGGGVFGALAFMGKIPGIALGRPAVKGGQPKGRAEARNGSQTQVPKQPEPKASPSKNTPPQAPPKPTPEAAQIQPPKPEPDLDKGAKSVARIWEKIDPEKVVQMAGSYKDPELARILNKMDPKKAAAIIGIMDAKRAALLSQQMEKLAALPTPAAESGL